MLLEMKPSRSDAVDTVQHSLVWNSSAALGRKVKLVPTWSAPLGEEMAGNVLLPGENARIARRPLICGWPWRTMTGPPKQGETMDANAKATNTQTVLQSITPTFRTG